MRFLTTNRVKTFFQIMKPKLRDLYFLNSLKTPGFGDGHIQVFLLQNFVFSSMFSSFFFSFFIGFFLIAYNLRNTLLATHFNFRVMY